jgi:uncharacterized protein YndB with AHSA1/START domain
MAIDYAITQVINAPVELVFEHAAALDRFQDWSPLNPTTGKRSEGEPAEGATFWMEIKGFGKVNQTLREFEKNKRFLVSPESKMFSGGGHRWIFTDLGNGTTQIDHEMEMLPRGIFKLMKPMIVKQGRSTIDTTTEHFKNYVEALAAAQA